MSPDFEKIKFYLTSNTSDKSTGWKIVKER